MKKAKDTELEKPSRYTPTDDFCEWWNPSHTDQISGASIGGHPEARRVWARKDPGRWSHRTFGINAVTAWQALRYVEEYDEWVSLGRPENDPFVSICVPLEKQVDFWRGVHATLEKMPKPLSVREEERERRKLLQEQKVKLLNAPNESVIDAEFTKVEDDDAIDF